MSFVIRNAVPEDAPDIAKVHIQSWKETYPGIMPQQRIDALNQESSTRNWLAGFERKDEIFVAVVAGQVVGFVSGGKNRIQDGCESGEANKCDCELAAMYLLRDFQGLGIGKALLHTLAERFKDLGFSSMVAWVAEKNPSVQFYAHLGGERIDRKILLVCEVEVPVLAYRYCLERTGL